MLQNPFFALIAPSHLFAHVAQVLAVALLAVALVLGLDLMRSGHLNGDILIYATQAIVVAVPLFLLMRGISKQIRHLQYKLGAVETRDPLTATYNRTAFAKHATRALPQSGALLVLDVDKLKMINQRLGHDAGDLCLMALAMKFRETMRSTDIVGRLDGATFAVYMPGAPGDIAVTIADRLRNGVHVTTAGGLLNVTVSIGAVLADGMTPLGTLMRDAVDALDEAKLAGRGSVILTELPEVA